ncbi:hypothetical protein P167DRAFT_547557 [Morchella conica CCBAS932]|uniref:Uncharacterized protein n=1 Tax=Morchella conica CCBAS932 TaxID=1392247 RepID=A0A3N4KHI4_9PEZI|nr:hypothetical protein P167DRAFT_547557 [Morchella conica CCBAS932]
MTVNSCRPIYVPHIDTSHDSPFYVLLRICRDSRAKLGEPYSRTYTYTHMRTCTHWHDLPTALQVAFLFPQSAARELLVSSSTLAIEDSYITRFPTVKTVNRFSRRDKMTEKFPRPWQKKGNELCPIGTCGNSGGLKPKSLNILLMISINNWLPPSFTKLLQTHSYHDYNNGNISGLEFG